jgi:hypothetical protein
MNNIIIIYNYIIIYILLFILFIVIFIVYSNIGMLYCYMGREVELFHPHLHGYL